MKQICRVCENAYDRDFHQFYADIAEFYSPERRCDNQLVSRLLRTQFSNDSILNDYVE